MTLQNLILGAWDAAMVQVRVMGREFPHPAPRMAVMMLTRLTLMMLVRTLTAALGMTTAQMAVRPHQTDRQT
jgi:hypothetical protein